MRMVLNNFFLNVILLSRCSSSWSLRSKICADEKITLNGTFEWKINSEDNDNFIISQPDVCWHNDSIVLRKCNFENGKWFPPQVQCKKYHSKNIKCPDELTELFINNEYLCFKISTIETAFNERFCYGSDLLIGYNGDETDKKILEFLLEEHKIESYWMPIKQYQDNEFNPFVIRLPGEHWNELFSFEGWSLFTSNRSLSPKHCIAASLQRDVGNPKVVTMLMQQVNCNELHYSVCVIEKHFVAKSGCPQDFGALSYRPNECYGITWDGQRYPEDYRMLNVIEYFKKINTINIIFEELGIVNDRFVEVAGAVEIPFTKWAIKPKTNEIKIASSKIKIHGLCLEYIESRKNVQMLLRLDPDLGSLVLTVYNKYYIWSNNKPEKSINCFTNADYEQLSTVELKKIWENDSQTKTIFELKIKNEDPGQYWCEAHSIFNFSHVSSLKVIAARASKGHAFAMQIEVPLTKFSFNFNFGPDQMKFIATSVRKDMKIVRNYHKQLDELVIHSVRIMDILYQNATHLLCICHTTVSIKPSEINSKEDNINQDVDEEQPLITLVPIKSRNLLKFLMYKYQPRSVSTTLSTEFCFPEKEWQWARLGQSAVKSTLCLQANGLPVTRRCIGNFISGTYWEKETIEDCINLTETSFISRHLFSIEKKTVAKEQLKNTIRDIRESLELNIKHLIPADFYYLARIMGNSIKYVFGTAATQLTTSETFTNNTFQVENILITSAELVRVLNFVLELNESVIRPSVVLNSTNILLDAFEYLIDHTALLEKLPENLNSSLNQTQMYDDDDREIEIIEYLDVGVVVKMATNFLVFIITPKVANVSGIALFRTEFNSSLEFNNAEGALKGAFRNEYYRFIWANQSVNDLLNEKDISIGTYMPTSLWERLDEISYMSNKTWQEERPEPKIVIKIYANDKLFQETHPSTDNVVKDKIISISIPGHDKDLPEVMPLILSISKENVGHFENQNENQSYTNFCGYWNYLIWANDGVTMINRSLINNNTILCGCTHLTPFAYLIGGNFNFSIDSDIEVVVKEIHKQALDIITIVGCSLSLFGIAGLFITACTFESWRKKANSKVLLQLSAAIALQMILFCFVNTEENSNQLITNQIYTSCIAIGACLHYSVLVQFCWMIIIAYLQFKRYVQVFGNGRPNRFFIKSAMLGWGLPLVPVACVIIFDSGSYIPQKDRSTNPLCYPTGISFYTSIVFPITFVITSNLIIFVVVIYHLLKNPAEAIRHTEKRIALSQIRLLVLLFFLLGFTWIFGLLNIMKTALIFSYLFCLTATLQGFILFLYFVIMDPATRRMWYAYFAKICGLKLNKESSSSVKETTHSF